MTASLRTGALLGRGKRGWRKALLTTALAIGAGYLSAPVFGQTLDDDSGQEVGPAPGTITVRLNGRVRIWGGIDADGDANRAVFTNVGVPSGAAVSAGTAFLSPVVSPGGPGSIPFGTIGVRGPGTTVVAAPAGTALQFNKQADYTITSYTRLYPGFDGVAANGLKYGASIEIRQDNSADAGGGVYGSISQQSRQRGELYIRREWGYIGTDQLGTLRIGSTDGPSGLYMVGNFENFNDGGWNGDIQNQIAMNVAPVWPFADAGSVYTTNKIIYLTPQFYGIDFGIAYEPNTGNTGQAAGSSGCNGNNAIGPFIPATQSIAGAGCDRLASTTTGDYTRRRNLVDAAIRYRGTFGPVGLAAYAAYIGSGKVGDSTPVGSPGFAARNQFDGLNLGAGGIAVTWAGLTVGGMAQGGRFNGAWNLSPTGASNSSVWLAGLSYTA